MDELLTSIKLYEYVKRIKPIIKQLQTLKYYAISNPWQFSSFWNSILKIVERSENLKKNLSNNSLFHK